MSGTILCVDNDRNLVQILSKALEAEGYRVLAAHDGDEAVEVARAERPDLVLLDVILPRRDGFAVLEALRASDAGGAATPVVLLSGATPGREYQRRAASLGALAFLTKPVPLEELLEVVSKHVAGPDGGSGSADGLSGSLATLPFPALLHHLGGLRATGVLHLGTGKRRKWLELRDGRPVAVRSNLVSECLGHFLASTNRINRSQLDESRRRMGEGQLQGEILVAMEILAEDEIPAVLRAQAAEKLLDIFSWRSGTFRFERNARLQRANELPVEGSSANLIFRGVRERMPIERIDDYLKSNAEARLAPAESPFYRFQELDLSPEHEALLDSLGADRPLAELQGADEDTRRTLYALVATGMLELRGARAPGPAAPPPRPREPAPPPPEDDALRAELAALAERVADADPFDVLEVAPSAADGEVREAYERLMARVHPDRARHSGAGRLADQIRKRVEEAFEILDDPTRRAALLLERQKADREAAKRKAARAGLDAELQFQYGEAALRQRDYGRALECFGRAVELNGEGGEYHAHYGWALHLSHPGDARKLNEAVGHVRQGLKLASESEKSYLFMGRLLLAAERPDVAEKMFTRAVQIQPECTEALRELRLMRMRREKSKGFVKRLFGR